VRKGSEHRWTGLPRVSIVIANYNGHRLLERCLDSLDGQTFRDFETIVVDNGSADGSRDLLAGRPGVRTVLLPENEGFAGGNNRGIREARGELVLLLNNDTECARGFLESLVAAADRHPEYSSFACKVLIDSAREFVDSAGLLLYPDGICRSRGWLEPDSGKFDVEEEVLAPCGCAAVFRKSCLDDTGLFDERYFAYLEDLDLGIRARLRGHRCLYVPTPPVYHVKSSTTGKHSREKAFLVERNRIWVAIKLLPLSLLLASPLLTLARYLCQGYAAMTYKGVSGSFTRNYSRFELLSILVRAYVSALRQLPAMVRERRRVQKGRRLKRVERHRLFWRWRLPILEMALKD